MEYSKKVIKEFMHPKNIGKMKDADGTGKIGNPTCGDIMQVQIKVGIDDKGKEIIKDIKFKTFGCAAAIATSSMITQLAKGKDLGYGRNISMQDITKSLKGLPPIKRHCASMASEALKKAIEDYQSKKNN